jgi:hypothetical protein
MSTNTKTMRPDPLFLIYKSRSGSTYLANILSGHPSISIAPESQLISRIWRWSNKGTKKVATRQQLIEVLELLYSESKFSTWRLSRERLFEDLLSFLPLTAGDLARQIILGQCLQIYPNCTVWGLKNGGWDIENLPMLRSLFPQAKFIHLVRDGRAVFASSKRATFSETGLPFETDPIRSALRWETFVSVSDRWKDKEFFLEIQYENLIEKPVDVLSKIITFLELVAEKTVIEEMVQPHWAFHIDERYSHLHPNVGKAPQHSRINAWREELSYDEVRLFEMIAGRALEKRGYPLMYPGSRWNDVYAVALKGISFGKRCLELLGIA